MNSTRHTLLTRLSKFLGRFTPGESRQWYITPWVVSRLIAMDESCELMERPSLDYLPLGKSSVVCTARIV